MPEPLSPHARILELTFSALVVQRAVCAAAYLRIPDLLADGSKTGEEIAEAAGTDPDAT